MSASTFDLFKQHAHLNNVFVTKKSPEISEVLTEECLKFLATLHRMFNEQRLHLVHNERLQRLKLLDQGQDYVFPVETESVRQGSWQVAKVPYELEKRYIEITGPPSFKGTINALNSGADVFMADFEDALAPTFENLITGQQALLLANKKTLTVKVGTKTYQLNDKVATLIVRPRGLHLDEVNVIVDGQPISGSIFDFGVYFFHNLKVRQTNQLGGVFYYLPKLEAYREARLWNDIFKAAQSYMSVPIGTIRCTVLIETIGGAIECEEILYELRDHIVALNAGRWDYLFSIIKKFKNRATAVLPDRLQLTMTVPFMKAYTDRLVHVCHKRGAHAIGGMSAFIPSKTDKQINEEAFKKVKSDKVREVQDGFDGSWVAHPDLVKVAREVFVEYLKGKDHQKDVMRNDVKVTPAHLTNFQIQNGTISEQGFQTNISVTIQYIYHWLSGSGAVGINNLMEDAATAEISRGQLWQWIKFGCQTDQGNLITKDYFLSQLQKEVEKLKGVLKDQFKLALAVEQTKNLVLSHDFAEFLTLDAYNYLISLSQPKL